MSNLIVDGDIWEARFVCEAQGQISVNRLFYRAKDQVGQGAEDAAFAQELDVQFGPELILALSAAAQYRGTSVQRAFPQPRTLAAVDSTANGLGTVGGDLLPTQIAGLVTLRTDFAGRAQRGRKYFPFTGGNANDVDGDPTAAHIAQLGVLGAECVAERLIAGPGGLGVDEIRMVPVIWRPPNGTPWDITSFVVRDHWATQRRRGELTSGDVAPF